MTSPTPPGFVFSLVCDRGFALGLYTHEHPLLGELVWLAEDFWEQAPAVSEVESATWRWCVFYPLRAAVRRHLVIPLGVTLVPERLIPFPAMRAGSRQQGWREASNAESDDLGPVTSDRSLPPQVIVNHAALRRMLVTDWRPTDLW